MESFISLSARIKKCCDRTFLRFWPSLRTRHEGKGGDDKRGGERRREEEMEEEVGKKTPGDWQLFCRRRSLLFTLRLLVFLWPLTSDWNTSTSSDPSSLCWSLDFSLLHQRSDWSVKCKCELMCVTPLYSQFGRGEKKNQEFCTFTIRNSSKNSSNAPQSFSNHCILLLKSVWLIKSADGFRGADGRRLSRFSAAERRESETESFRRSEFKESVRINYSCFLLLCEIKNNLINETLWTH